jgi:hypothetical protein
MQGLPPSQVSLFDVSKFKTLALQSLLEHTESRLLPYPAGTYDTYFAFAVIKKLLVKIRFAILHVICLFIPMYA